MLVDSIPNRLKYVKEVCDACEIAKQRGWYRRCIECSSYHNGKYKLLLSSMQFLDLISEDSVVVYVGSAPFAYGHIISNLYPNMKFILFDPQEHKFDDSSKTIFNSLTNLNPLSLPHFSIFEQLFDDDKCELLLEMFGEGGVAFMSDIRLSDGEPTNSEVYSDLIKQQTWVEILKPKLFWLKFRCLFDVTEPMLYLDGDLCLQAYTPRGSNECRLIGNTISYKFYDPVEHEEKLNYFNKVMRPATDLEIEKLILVDHFKDVRLARLYAKSYRLNIL